MREAIELAVLREAVGRLPASFFAAARALIAGQREAAAGDDLERFLGLDDAFHRSFADAIDLGHAWSVVEAQKTQMDRVRFLSLPGRHAGRPPDRPARGHPRRRRARRRRSERGGDARPPLRDAGRARALAPALPGPVRAGFDADIA